MIVTKIISNPVIIKKLKVGDLFAVPSNDGGRYICQVVYVMKELHNVFLYFFENSKFHGEYIPNDFSAETSKIISGFFVTPENFYNKWAHVGNQPYPNHSVLEKVERVKIYDLKGMITIGGGLVSKYVDTYFGIYPMESWPMPEYVMGHFLPK